MTHALSDLVTFVGRDDEWMERTKQAVEWIASKPEGIALLVDAYQLHGEPITLVVDGENGDLGYGHNGKNMIVANPIIIESQMFYSSDGGYIHNSLERFLSHEFKHAGQHGLLAVEPEYDARRTQIQDAYVKQCDQIIHQPFLGFPIARYAKRLQACKDNAALLKLLGEAYDTDIAPQFIAAFNARVERSEADPLVKMVIDTYELPAIRSENALMKYKGEPGRMEDYLRSEVLQNEDGKEPWCNFVLQALAVQRNAALAIEHGGGRSA